MKRINPRRQVAEVPFVIKDNTNSFIVINNIFMQMKWRNLTGRLLFFVALIWLTPFYILFGVLSCLDTLLKVISCGTITRGITKTLTTLGYLGNFEYVSLWIETNKYLRYLTAFFWFLTASPAVLFALLVVAYINHQ